VTITIVTWNSQQDILRCLEALKNQDYSNLETILVDNASEDETVNLVKTYFPNVCILKNYTNKGFSAGHNQAIRAGHGEFVLILNPDAVLANDYISKMVEAVNIHPSIGMVSGKLWRHISKEAHIIDTTGIILTRNHRHLDRGFNTIDKGQYDEPCMVFGVSGCCAFLKKKMLDDVAFQKEILDEDFFAYREDVDLCWRAQWRGWKAIYYPHAEGFHRRSVYPSNRKAISSFINRLSVKNRFLLRIKNQDWNLILRFFFETTFRDLQVFGYIFLKEWSSVPAIFSVLKLFPRFLKKRKFVFERRKVGVSYMKLWFYKEALPMTFLKKSKEI
jgi:GT2 family glycosyltransferase